MSLSLVAACDFDDATFADLRRCSSQVDCTSPLSPFCVAGRCVAGEPSSSGEGEGEAGGSEAGEGNEGDADAGEGEGEELPPGDPPISVVQTPATASVGDRVGLRGAQSVGRGLDFTWTVTAPDESDVAVTADPDDASAASFIATRRGAYRVGLRVADDVHRTDTGQEQEVEVVGFDALDRQIEGLDIGASSDGEAAWIATADGASRAELLPAPEDDPTAERTWAWTDYPDSGQGTDNATVGPRSAWLARTTSGALRIRRSHAADDLRPATPQALPGVGRVRAMAVGPALRIWFGGDDGLRRTLGNEGGSLGPPLDLPGERSVLALHAAEDGLWVGRSTGACLAPWTDEAQLSCGREISVIEGVDHLITAMAVDGGGDLWIATDAQGLYRVPPGDAPDIEVIAPGARNLPAGRIDDLAVDPSGDVWLVAAGQLLRIYVSPVDPPFVQLFETGTGLAVIRAVRAVTVAGGDNADVWVVAARGVARLNR